MTKNQIHTDEDTALEIYLKLILEYNSKGKSTRLFEERYNELLTRKLSK